MCLAYHTKGQCNVGCGRKADHVPYTNDEYAPLVTWCAANFPTSWNFGKGSHNVHSFPPINLINNSLLAHCNNDSLLPTLNNETSPLPTPSISKPLPASTTTYDSTTQQHNNTSQPPTKKLRLPTPDLPADLGKYIARDASLIQQLGWASFVNQRRPWSDFSSLHIHHPARGPN